MTSRQDSENNLPKEVMLTILPLRGFLLWLVVPIGAIAWIGYYRWARSVTIGQCLKWFDLNLIAFLQRLLKRSERYPDAPWVPSRMMSSVTRQSRPYDFLG